MESYFQKRAAGIYQGDLEPPVGALGELLREFSADVIIGHPTFRNEKTIGAQIKSGIQGALINFAGRRTAFIVSDGTYTSDNRDNTTMEAALSAAQEALNDLPEDAREHFMCVATPYEGYGGDRTPGKGSALKLIFEEMAFCPARLLILLDGDLRNDMGQWQRVFAAVESEHRARQAEREFFITAKYARHFVDASLTRFIVGPLTTLLGMYVPGGISGDIVLSAGAVERERGPWSEERRRYGTDISTTFDNLANPNTLIYEVYLGAKLHDITDEAKLSVMPGEVIGAALERMVHYREDVRKVLAGNAALGRPVQWGPEKTGIAFIDPGYTDVFDVDVKIQTLVERWSSFEAAIGEVYGEEQRARLAIEVENLKARQNEGDVPLEFLGIDIPRWAGLLGKAVARALATGEIESTKRALNYLYTAAFVEFCAARLKDLGLETINQVRAGQKHLGVPARQAEAFYREKVDREAEELAYRFYRNRREILEYWNELGI